MKYSFATVWGGLALLVLCTQCTQNVVPRDYPLVRTLPVSQVTSEGVTVSAEFIFRGDEEILEYGFVWGETENVRAGNSDRLLFSGDVIEATFSADITSTLGAGQTYVVRAFVATAEYEIYGNGESFVSQGSQSPELVSVSPLSGTVGDSVTVVGRRFSVGDSQPMLSFGDQAVMARRINDTTYWARVPFLEEDEVPVSLISAGQEATFSEVFRLTTPTITSVVRTLFSSGRTVVVSGTGFSVQAINNLVFIAGVPCTVLNASKTELSFLTPELNNLQGPALSLSVSGREAVYTEPVTFTVPYLDQVTPTQMYWGDTLTLTGQLLGQGSLFVIGQRGYRANPLSQSNLEIKFLMPPEFPDTVAAIRFESGIQNTIIDNLSINPPEISSATPSVISAAQQAETMVISGRGFNVSNPEFSIQILKQGSVLSLPLTIPGSRPLAAFNATSATQLEFPISLLFSGNGLNDPKGIYDVRVRNGSHSLVFESVFSIE